MSMSTATVPASSSAMTSDGSSAAVSVKKQQQPCAVEVALVGAQRDLEDANYKYFGFFLNPLREVVLKPALNVGIAVLPPVAQVVPLVDQLTAFGLEVPFTVARHVYHATHSEQFTAQYKIYHDAMEQLDEFVDTHVAEKLRFKLSEAHNDVGYYLSTWMEFWSAPLQNLHQWYDYTNRVVAYAKSLGIEQELLEPLLSDRYDVNQRILGRVQEMDDNTTMRRIKTAIPGATFHGSEQVVAKLMRYSCSAYGKNMMEAHDIVAKKHNLELSPEYRALEGGEALKVQVCSHVGIPTDYITHFNLGYGGDMKLLRYYISTDHQLGAVVLVIRGTYSISQWYIDFQGQSKAFCGGMAHSGIADLATELAKASRDQVLACLQQYPNYKVIITGQSLGGGVSPLVNILFHMDPVLGQQYKIECHAFAGPPVYYAESIPAIVAKAIGNCTHYIHGDDVVPYMGVHSVRRLNAKLNAIDRVTKQMGFLRSKLTAMGRKSVTPQLVDAALNGDGSVKTIPGAPNLAMPAKEIVWFVVDNNNEVTYMVCDPKAHSELGILLSPIGFSDHVPRMYELILNKAEVEGWKQLSA